MRENCTYGSEGGEGHTLPDPYPGSRLPQLLAQEFDAEPFFPCVRQRHFGVRQRCGCSSELAAIPT